METRHPVEGQFGSEFPAICNHCGVMVAGWSRKTWKFCEQFLFCFFKRPLRQHFQNSVPNVSTASLIDVVVFKCHKICPRGNRWNRALFNWPKSKKKNFDCLWNGRYCAHCAQNLQLHWPAPNNVLAFRSNYVPFLHCFWNTARIQHESTIWTIGNIIRVYQWI